MNTQRLAEFISENKLENIMWNVNIGNEYLYSYAKTKKDIIIKYHSKFDNFSIQVEWLEKSIVDINRDWTRNKLFDKIIERLQSATPVEKSVDTMIDELDLF